MVKGTSRDPAKVEFLVRIQVGALMAGSQGIHLIPPLEMQYNIIMRRFFVITLTLLTVAGPSLCCCMLPRVALRAVEVPSCCHVPADNQPPPCKEQCPCREHRERPATVSEALATDLPTPVIDFVAWDVVACVPDVLVSIGAVGLPPPFLSTELLLHVHHRLRC
jgi:hypothetical protein